MISIICRQGYDDLAFQGKDIQEVADKMRECGALPFPALYQYLQFLMLGLDAVRARGTLVFERTDFTDPEVEECSSPQQTSSV